MVKYAYRSTTNEGIIIMMTTTEVAVQFETDARTLRKFLRSQDLGVGKGSRYALPSTKRDLNALQKRFTAWDEARKAPITDETPESDNTPESD